MEDTNTNHNFYFNFNKLWKKMYYIKKLLAIGHYFLLNFHNIKIKVKVLSLSKIIVTLQIVLYSNDMTGNKEI